MQLATTFYANHSIDGAIIKKICLRSKQSIRISDDKRFNFGMPFSDFIWNPSFRQGLYDTMGNLPLDRIALVKE